MTDENQQTHDEGFAQPEGHKLAATPRGDEIADATVTGASVQAQDDERVPSGPLNSTVTSDQSVTEPGRPGPDQNDGEPDVAPTDPPETEPSV